MIAQHLEHEITLASGEWKSKWGQTGLSNWVKMSAPVLGESRVATEATTLSKRM